MGMKALLDSNIIIHLAQNKIDFDSFSEDYDDLCISIITYMEVLGYRFKDESYKQKIESLLSLFTRLEITEEVVKEVVAIRQRYTIKLPDAIILATARTFQCELISNNAKDFSGETKVRSIALKVN
jgi:predicted nucleic acid-binding protein